MRCSMAVSTSFWAIVILCTFSRAFDSSLYPCPAPCSGRPNDWTLYTSVDRLKVCHQPMLLDFSLHTPLDAPETMVKLFACTVKANDGIPSDAHTATQSSELSAPNSRRTVCVLGKETTATLDLGIDNPDDSPWRQELDIILAHAQSYVSDGSHCDSLNIFGYLNGTVVGVYSGAAIDNSVTALSILQNLRQQISNPLTPRSAIIQLCGEDRNADYTFGAAVDTTGNIADVQKSVSAWSDAQCVRSRGYSTQMGNFSIFEKPLRMWPRSHPFRIRRTPSEGIDCAAETIVSGDSCASLAAKCGISGDELLEYNRVDGLCSSLMPGNQVCCNNGTANTQPTPPSENRDCTAVTIRSGDSCASLAEKCGISGNELLEYNEVDDLCSSLMPGSQVCCNNGTTPITHPMPPPESRDCAAEIIVSGDSCASLAAKCGISGDKLLEYNAVDNLCSSLMPGSQVCCDNGTVPNTRPTPNEDGSCAAYTIESTDTCKSIAASHGLEDHELSYFNNEKTWGWFGCGNLPLGLTICVSAGDPPVPTPVSNAVCGPTVPGTKLPADGMTLAELNPCPLNACCNIWGKCGITPEYCTPEVGPVGNPGTAPAGRQGCISNCGTDITNNHRSPAQFLKVGYYESWNWNRPCLKLRAGSINVAEYTHVHWAFATIDRDFGIGIKDPHDQWNDFIALKGVKRVISFGGWGYPTSSGTWDVLRAAMDPENVDTFVQNIFEFVQRNDLDGIDFDWEYPGAFDIPSVPEGFKSDGPNYLAFLRKIKEVFPPEKVLAIAAPSSYWYLKAFPIEEMSTYLDYLVFMTYDLHGQWDYDSHWTQDSCKEGNCLRSHVNRTETEYALAMVTKAGVPSDKITVGVSSYGRSFGMSEEGCSSPECNFEGPESTAHPGVCTQIAGILANAEIEDLIQVGNATEFFYDKISDSNILVYDNTQWVSYMNRSTKMSRIEYYERQNFTGYADWAIDLEDWTDANGEPLSEGYLESRSVPHGQ